MTTRDRARRAANRSRHPHAEQTFAVKRLDDGLRQLTVFIAPMRVLVGEHCDVTCTIDRTGSLQHGGYFTVMSHQLSVISYQLSVVSLGLRVVVEKGSYSEN